MRRRISPLPAPTSSTREPAPSASAAISSSTLSSASGLANGSPAWQIADSSARSIPLKLRGAQRGARELGRGGAEQEALRAVAAQRLQGGELLGRLDRLGDRLEP